MIVITGAAGFIGSCIVAKLNERGLKDLILIDQAENGAKSKNLEHKTYAQLIDKDDFLKLIKNGQFDSRAACFIHMGACSSTTLQDKQHFEENNFKYTQILAQWALKHNVHFIYASSAATYGDGSNGYQDNEETIRRSQPLNLYGESKQKFDLWALDKGILEKIVGLKFFNVFGPNEYHKGDMRSVTAKAYERVKNEGRISLFKSYKPQYRDGEQKRDFIYVKDAVDVVMFFLDHPEIRGIYNVGTGEARTWNDLARSLFAALGKTPQIDYIDMPASLKSRYQYFTQADIAKLRNVGYNKPFTRLEDAVKDYAQYLNNHRYL